MTDSLDRIIAKQRGLQDRVGPKIRAFGEAGGSDGTTFYLKENSNCLAREAGEALDALPWKMHRTDFGRPITPEERERFIEETVDCLHFVINMFLGAGISTAQEIESRFFAKNDVNHERWDHER
jgi:NTP pyrophosphatase (non-canonical NTP hydrolase)